MKEYKPSLQTGYLLKVVQHEIRKRMDEELREIDLTTPQYAALSILNEFPGISNAELSRKCFITPQTMNLIIHKLEKRKIIEKTASLSHGRIQNIALTGRGRKLLDEADKIVMDVENKLTRKLSDGEKKTLNELLLKIDTE